MGTHVKNIRLVRKHDIVINSLCLNKSNFRISIRGRIMVYHSIEMNISLWSTQHHKYVSSWPVALIHLGRTILLFAHILDRSSFSQILSYILFLLVNSGFTMPIKLYWNKQNAIKLKIIKIRWGTMFCIRRIFRRKF